MNVDTILRHGPLLATALLSTGCASHMVSTASRNLVETVTVETRGDEISLASTYFILELQTDLKEIAFTDADSFLSSEESWTLDRRLRSEISEKKEKVDQTISRATDHGDARIILTKPRPGDPYSDENIVLYLRGHDGYHVRCSIGEIDEIFESSVARMEDDFESIVFTHPRFKSGDLDALRDELGGLGIALKHARLSDDEIEALRILKAVGILEDEVRSMGVELRADEPILEGRGAGRARSPKLSTAFEDRSVLARIEGSDEPAVTVAFNYLVEKNVIKLAAGE